MTDPAPMILFCSSGTRKTEGKESESVVEKRETMWLVTVQPQSSKGLADKAASDKRFHNLPACLAHREELEEAGSADVKYTAHLAPVPQEEADKWWPPLPFEKDS